MVYKRGSLTYQQAAIASASEVKVGFSASITRTVALKGKSTMKLFVKVKLFGALAGEAADIAVRAQVGE